MKHKNISIIFISLLIIAILLMMSPNMLAYTIPAVENLKVEYTDGTAYLSWSSVANADGYEVFVNIPGYGYANIGSVSDNKVSVIGISEDTAYSVKVRAYEYVNNIRETGSFSNEVDFDTNKEADLDRVTGVKVETTENIANVSWNSVSGADGYEVYLSEDGGSYKHVLTTKYVKEIITDLEYNTSYRVKVRAYKEVNGREKYGSYSSAKSFKTERYSSSINNEDVGKVTNVKATVTGSTVYLSWKSVPGAVKYEILFTVPGYGGATSIWSEGPGRTISGLTTKDSNYTARVRAYKYVDGRLVPGEYSDVVRFHGE